MQNPQSHTIDVTHYLRKPLKQQILISPLIRSDIKPKLKLKNVNLNALFASTTPNCYFSFHLGIMQITSEFYLINVFELIYKIFNYITLKTLFYKGYRDLNLIAFKGLKKSYSISAKPNLLMPNLIRG